MAVVGETYLVPTVPVVFKHPSRRVIRCAVIGPPHSDPEFGVGGVHVHHDERFTPEEVLDLLRQYNPDPLAVFVEDLPYGMREVRGLSDLPSDEEAVGWYRQVLEYLPMVCVREFRTSMPPVSVMPDYFPRLAEAMGNARMKCLTCPHKGFPLAGVKPDDGGVVLCPAHGMRWNLATGEFVPTTADGLPTLAKWKPEPDGYPI